MKSFSQQPLFVFILLGAMLSGCGGAQTPFTDITGTITIAGNLPKVPGRLEIAFVDCKGKLTVARIAEDGTYHAEGIATGETKVYFIYIGLQAIEASANKGRGRKAMAQDSPQPQTKEAASDIPNPIPLKLREALTSGLCFTAQTAQTNTYNFDIPPP